MSPDRPNYAAEIKAALNDPTRLLERLGILGEGRQRARQAKGWLVVCPLHGDRTPSLSVQQVDGIVKWLCHGCGESGDALTLVAAVRGLSMRGKGFVDVLVEAATLAGLWGVVDALRNPERPTPAPVAAPLARPAPPEAPRVYPADAGAFWGDCAPVSADAEAAAYLAGRAIDPELAEGRDLVRALPAAGVLPPWARFQGRSWRETGHRMVVPMVDAAGAIRSVRAWRVTEGESPKRLPPAGHKASELVMADPWALAWLRGQRVPERVVIAEGEPDFCTWAVRLNDPATTTIGIVSGSWTAALAARFPVGCRVDVWTDHDEAGDRYFAEIAASLRRRCFVYRAREAA